jgi:hypothetical protein
MGLTAGKLPGYSSLPATFGWPNLGASSLYRLDLQKPWRLDSYISQHVGGVGDHRILIPQIGNFPHAADLLHFVVGYLGTETIPQGAPGHDVRLKVNSPSIQVMSTAKTKLRPYLRVHFAHGREQAMPIAENCLLTGQPELRGQYTGEWGQSPMSTYVLRTWIITHIWAS